MQNIICILIAHKGAFVLNLIMKNAVGSQTYHIFSDFIFVDVRYGKKTNIKTASHPQQASEEANSQTHATSTIDDIRRIK